MPGSNVIMMPVAHGDDPELDSEISVTQIQFSGRFNSTARKLFYGFDTLRVITFSASAGFVDKIVGMFEYAEIILGAEFLARRNKGLHDAAAQAIAAGSLTLVGGIPQRYKNIGDMMRSGSLEVRISDTVLDHRKIYILSAKDGRTRVITGSANMSGAAWCGEHYEEYRCDDTREGYDDAIRRFNAAWPRCGILPLQVEKVDEDDIMKGNVVVDKNIQLNNGLLMPAHDDCITRDVVEYVIRQDELADEIADAIKPVAKMKDGMCRITAKSMQKAAQNLQTARVRREVKLSVSEKPYPKMEFTYDGYDSEMKMDGEAVSLDPAESDVRADIDNLFAIFRHFDDGSEFVGNLDGLRKNHYRFLIYMLISPHIAKLRCAAYMNGIDPTKYLPLFVVLTSRQPNTGKTFMAQAVLSLMTGCTIGGDKGEGEGVTDRLREAQSYVKCTPYLFDEVSSKSFAMSFKNMLKNSDMCEKFCREQQPVIVLTSNEMADPDDVVRKRAVHLLYDAALSSDVDQNAFGNQGSRLKRQFTGALYREFTRRVLPEVSNMLDNIYSKDMPDGWYPDVVDLSSRIFLEILHDYNYNVPEYMARLGWHADYDSAWKTSENTISELQKLYALHPELFQFDGDKVEVSLGFDKRKLKLMDSWYNTLPPEVEAETSTGRDSGAVLTMSLSGLKRFGFQCNGLRHHVLSFLKRRR